MHDGIPHHDLQRVQAAMKKGGTTLRRDCEIRTNPRRLDLLISLTMTIKCLHHETKFSRYASKGLESITLR
jgi:hypothetical protein